MSGEGRQIRLARLKAGLSQGELAIRAGTSQSAVSRYEQGRTIPGPRTTARLVGACQSGMRPRNVLFNNREKVLRLASAYGVVSVRIFGSTARNEDDSESDLDLLVEIPPERLRLLGLIELGNEISDILGVVVDIGTPEMLKPSIRQQVLSEAIPL